MTTGDNVLHILAGTDIGGSEILILNLAKAEDKPFRLHIISSKGGILENDFRSTAEQFCIIPRKIFLDPVYIFRIYRYCCRHNIKVIHCHQLLECFNTLIIARILRITILLTFHGYFYLSKNIIVRLIGLFVARNVDLNLFVSRTLRDHYIEKYSLTNIRSSVIYNGIHIINEEDYDTDSLRKEIGATKKDIVIGMTGNFASARNHILVCRAFGSLVRTFPESDRLKLVFIGREDKSPSPLFREADRYCREEGIGNYVTFAGPRKEAGRLVRNFDLFVYAARRETFCLSVVEAMAAGVPVIVNDLPVMNEITNGGEFAILFATDDENDLYRKLSESVSRIDIIKGEAEALKKIVQSEYSVIKHFKRLSELYKLN